MSKRKRKSVDVRSTARREDGGRAGESVLSALGNDNFSNSSTINSKLSQTEKSGTVNSPKISDEDYLSDIVISSMKENNSILAEENTSQHQEISSVVSHPSSTVSPAFISPVSSQENSSVGETSTKTLEDWIQLVNIYYQASNDYRDELAQSIVARDRCETEIAELKARVVQILDASKNQEKLLEERFYEFGILTKKLVELEAELQEKDSQIEHFTQHAVALEGLDATLKTLVNMVNIRSDSVDIASSKKINENAIQANLYDHLSILQREIKSIQEDLHASNAKASEWQEKYINLEKEKLNIFNDYQKTILEVSDLKNENTGFRSETNNLKSQVDALKKMLNDRTRAMREETANRLVVERALAKIKKSLSWRLTKPIRMIESLKGTSNQPNKSVDKIFILVKESGYFDADWYYRNHAEVRQSKMDPLEYFCTKGIHQNHDPGPNFSNDKYAEKYPDVAKSTIPSFLHFLLHGKSEGRSI